MGKGITTLVATRDRPEQALATYISHESTKVLPDSRIYFGIDYDEPQIDAYRELLPFPSLWQATKPDSGSLVKVTNAMADTFREESYVFGSVGDDHRFRTTGWDALIALALKNSAGIAYGDDKFQGIALPTACYMSVEIYDILGWFALPTCDHMYIDNCWLAIGQMTKRLHWLPNVVIEHLHYAAGKSRLDESYKRTNTDAQKTKDRRAFDQWIINDMKRDIARIREALDA